MAYFACGSKALRSFSFQIFARRAKIWKEKRENYKEAIV
jgi:hypothetical protein